MWSNIGLIYKGEGGGGLLSASYNYDGAGQAKYYITLYGVRRWAKKP